MIRLNETLFKDLVLGRSLAPSKELTQDTTAATMPPESSSEPTCPPMDSHLISVRMQLYPSFSSSMTAQIDSIRRINGSMPASGIFSVSSSKSGGVDVKDSVVSVVVQRYADLFDTFLKLSDETDEDLIFSRYVCLSET